MSDSQTGTPAVQGTAGVRSYNLAMLSIQLRTFESIHTSSICMPVDNTEKHQCKHSYSAFFAQKHSWLEWLFSPFEKQNVFLWHSENCTCVHRLKQNRVLALHKLLLTFQHFPKPPLFADHKLGKLQCVFGVSYFEQCRNPYIFRKKKLLVGQG